MTEFYYVNSINQKLDFMRYPYIAKDLSRLRDYGHSYECYNNKISKLYNGISEIPFSINICADLKQEYQKAANQFFEITECDVVSKRKGRLYLGEYYVECNLISNVKSDWHEEIGFHIANVNMVTDHPYWCREKTYSFKASTKEIIDAETKEEIESTLDNSTQTPDYPYDYKRGYITKYKQAKKRYLRDYKYDYYHNHTVAKLDNDHFAESAFKMIVYGPCTHPHIQIGDHIYEVNTTLYDGEYMVIDSRERTVVKYTRYGTEENLFNARSREYYLFQKIPAGKLLVKWNRQYPFDIILYQERSEPPWSM